MKPFLFSALLCCFSVLSRAQALQEVPITILPSGHIQVKATVNGVEGSFIFDTGAGLTVFTKQFFNKLRDTTALDGGFTAFRATGERLDIALYTVRNIVLGKVKKAEEEVSYLDMDMGGMDGILSLKMLESQPFTIDFEKKVIRFETPQSIAALRKTGHVMPLQPEQSRGKALDIFAYFRVNDSLTLQLALDSGAGQDVFKFNAKYMQRLGIDVSDTLLVKRREKRSELNPAFTSNTYTATLKKLAVAESPAVNITDLKAQFVDGLIYDGIIWINWLGSQITINLPGKEMLIQR